MGVISGNHCKISFPFQTVLPCDTLSCAHNWWIKADKLCTLSFQVPYTHSRFTHTSPLCSMLLSIKQQHMHSRTIHWKLIENFEILASTLVFPPPPATMWQSLYLKQSFCLPTNLWNLQPISSAARRTRSRSCCPPALLSTYHPRIRFPPLWTNGHPQLSFIFTDVLSGISPGRRPLCPARDSRHKFYLFRLYTVIELLLAVAAQANFCM